MTEAAAALLLKQNPTPLEPASYLASDESYQIAKVTWLPDYLGNNKGYGDKRVNAPDNGDCEIFGFIDNCPEHQIGKGVKHPLDGLTCYEQCVCDTSYYKYTTSNCTAPKKLGGDNCVWASSKYYTQCSCPAEYNLSVCPTGAACEQCNGKYKQTGCDSGYNLSSSLGNADCTPCTYNGTTKYKCICKEGYSLSGNICVAECSGYSLTVCPEGGSCTPCPEDNAKQRLDSCDTSKGWKKSEDSCEAVSCPAGYTAGVTSCTSGSTKPDYSSNGWSGGKQCGVCKCNNIDSNCTAANYPVTSIPSNAAQTGSCTTGCGTEKVTRYKFKCNDGYILKDNQCQSGSYVKIAVNAPSDNTALKFTLSGSGYTIDWGDGTTDANSSHTYAKAGDYIVTMTEGITSLETMYSDVKITKLHKLNMNTLKKAAFFHNCSNLTGNIPELPPSLTNGGFMFHNCTGLTGSIPELPASLKDGTSMFTACTGLTGNIPELPASLTNGNRMFAGCTGLTGNIPALPNSLTIGEGMFTLCSGLTGNIPKLPTSLENGYAMFAYCAGLTGNIPELPSFLTNGNTMFLNCTGLTGNIPVLPPLETAADMFNGCTGLTGNLPALPTSLIDGSRMFRGCSGLTYYIPPLPPILANAYGMFADCTGLSGNIPTLPPFLENGQYMFNNCIGLTGIAPSRPARLSLCDRIFQNTKVTITNEWQNCQ